MSKYTTEVRYICETAAGLDESVGYDSVNSVLQEAAPKIFNFDFPIFDSAYRLPLEIKILRHYYTREISEETVGLWKLRLESRMNEIMPYYNKLYTSETLEFNPLYDVDYTREYTKDTSGETTGTEVVRDSGTVADAKTGSDTLTDTVSDVLEKTGTESVARTGTDTLDRTGTDTVTNSGTDTSAKTGTEQVGSSGTIKDQGTNSNTETRNYSDATTIGKDSWDLYSDTPQGGINGLLDNGRVESGTDLPNNTYLTNARHIMESGNAGSTTHSGTIGNNGTNSNTRTLGTTETTTYNTQDQRTLNTTEQRTLNTKDKTTKALDDTTTYDTEDSRDISGTHQQVYNNTNTKTLNTTKSGNTSGTITNTDEYVERVYGKMGGYTYSKALLEYRKTLINIDMMIIDDLKDLFFGLW